ncbi:C-C chemokine receptor type 1 [Engraulis encrasicolus]|uniref:C-C chemokine receptor type 1 n=1 Tax=Engraulis encrasicolus TaxID=184585 RepID=UPI002FD417F1
MKSTINSTQTTSLPGLQDYATLGLVKPTVSNIGEENDYGDYYSSTETFEPCNITDLKAFAGVFLPTLYSLVFVTGLLGNGLVVCVLLWFRRRCNLTDVCLLNLALSDLLFVLSLPLWATYAAKGSWPWNIAMCRLMTLLYTTGFYGSIGFMVAMTLDRYLLIIHHSSTTAWRTFRFGMVMIGAVWGLSLIASLPSVVFADVNTTQGANTCATEIPHDSWWRSFDYIEMNVLGLILPLAIMVGCYGRIIPTLLKMKTQKKHKAIKLIVAIIITFFVFWTPYHIVLFLHLLKQRGYFPECHQMNQLDLAMKVTETLAFTHCCLNPIIYAFAGEKFCRLVVKMLGKWLPLFSASRDFSSERRSSVYSRSSEMTSTKLL